MYSCWFRLKAIQKRINWSRVCWNAFWRSDQKWLPYIIINSCTECGTSRRRKQIFGELHSKWLRCQEIYMSFPDNSNWMPWENASRDSHSRPASIWRIHGRFSTDDDKYAWISAKGPCSDLRIWRYWANYGKKMYSWRNQSPRRIWTIAYCFRLEKECNLMFRGFRYSFTFKYDSGWNSWERPFRGCKSSESRSKNINSGFVNHIIYWMWVFNPDNWLGLVNTSPSLVGWWDR